MVVELMLRVAMSLHPLRSSPGDIFRGRRLVLLSCREDEINEEWWPQWVAALKSILGAPFSEPYAEKKEPPAAGNVT